MRAVTCAVAIALWSAGATLARAQTGSSGPLVRLDAHGAVGWANVYNDDVSSGDARDGGVARACGGVGWYWTDHVKSELEAGANSTAEFYGFERIDGPVPTYLSSRVEIDSWSVGLGQYYQFFRNAWFHPFVGGGVELRWETRTEHVDPVFVFDPRFPQAPPIAPARTIGPDHSFLVRPFVTTGFKAYVAPRAFFRTDLRVAGADGVGEVQARFGFGMDF